MHVSRSLTQMSTRECTSSNYKTSSSRRLHSRWSTLDHRQTLTTFLHSLFRRACDDTKNRISADQPLRPKLMWMGLVVRDRNSGTWFALDRVISEIFEGPPVRPRASTSGAMRSDDWRRSSYDHRTVSISAISVLVALSSGILRQRTTYSCKKSQMNPICL